MLVINGSIRFEKYMLKQGCLYIQVCMLKFSQIVRLRKPLKICDNVCTLFLDKSILWEALNIFPNICIFKVSGKAFDNFWAEATGWMNDVREVFLLWTILLTKKKPNYFHFNFFYDYWIDKKHLKLNFNTKLLTTKLFEIYKKNSFHLYEIYLSDFSK